jgi:hypothetical protein
MYVVSVEIRCESCGYQFRNGYSAHVNIDDAFDFATKVNSELVICRHAAIEHENTINHVKGERNSLLDRVKQLEGKKK